MPSESEQHLTQSTKLKPSKPKVLHVDDTEDVIGFLRIANDRGMLPFDLVFASCGDEAYALLQESGFDAVVLDVNLLGESGMSIAIKLTEQMTDLPGAFLTAYDRSVTRENAEEINWPVWSKPIELPDYIKCVQELIKGKPTSCAKAKGQLQTPQALRAITHSVFVTLV